MQKKKEDLDIHIDMVRKSVSDVVVFAYCKTTWYDVSHARDQLQVQRTNTCSWTEAQLHQVVVAVLTFP